MIHETNAQYDKCRLTIRELVFVGFKALTRWQFTDMYSEAVYSTSYTARRSLLAVPRDFNVDRQVQSYCMPCMTFQIVYIL
jgi:hypothetical protein